MKVIWTKGESDQETNSLFKELRKVAYGMRRWSVMQNQPITVQLRNWWVSKTTWPVCDMQKFQEDFDKLAIEKHTVIFF